MKYKQGILLAVIAASISGFSIFYNKLVIVKDIDPLVFNILKNGGVGIILSLLLISGRKLPKLKTITKRQWVKLWTIAIVGGSIPFILYFDALKSVSAVNANIIQKSMFIWVAMMAIPLLGERLTKIQLIGYVLIAWSNLFLGGFSGFTWSKPELMILLATFLWSIENIVAKITMKEVDATIVTWARMALGAVILFGIAISQNKLGLFSKLTVEQVVITAGSVLLLTGYVSFWYRALSRAPTVLVTSVLILATPITNILSATFITHTFPAVQIQSALGTVLGLVIITYVAQKLWTKPVLQ